MDAGFLRGLERRVFSLERRLSAALRSLRFTDLEDVPPFAEITAPDTDETTVWAVDWDTFDSPRWMPVNIGAGGGTGGYATARASGNTSPYSWLDWSQASDPAWEPTLYAGGLGSDLCGGIVIAEPGFYDIAAVGVSEDAFTIEALSTASGWQFADEDPPACRYNLSVIEHAEAGDGGASGSIQMALAAEDQVLVRVVTAGFVVWSLSVELVAPADIVDGSCGG